MYEVTWAERVQSGEYLVHYLRAIQVFQRVVQEDLRLVWVAAGVWVLPDIGDLIGEALDRAYLTQQQHGFLRLRENFYGVVLPQAVVDWLISVSSGEVFFYPGVLDGTKISSDPFVILTGSHSLLMMPRPGSATFNSLSPQRKHVIHQRYQRARSAILGEPCA